MRSYSVTHLGYLLRRVVKGRQILSSAASETIEICPAETSRTPPAIRLPGQEDKVIGFHPMTSYAHEKRRIDGGDGLHKATMAYKLHGAVLCDGGVYKDRWARYVPLIKPTGSKSIWRSSGAAAFASSALGVKYFGHWVRDDIGTYLLAETFGEPISARMPDWSDVDFYAKAYRQNWTPTDFGCFEYLYVFDDIGQNSNRAARLRELRRRMRVSVAAEQPGRRVYLRRGETGAVKRIVANEEEIISALRGEGFIVLDITKDNISDIMRHMLDAQIVVTVEGSQQNHALPALADGGVLLNLMPPDVFSNLSRDWTAILGLEYGFVVGEKKGDGFSINASELLKTIDLAETAINKRKMV